MIYFTVHNAGPLLNQIVKFKITDIRRVIFSHQEEENYVAF